MQQTAIPQPGLDPVFHVDVNTKRGIMDRPNPDLLGGEDGLKVLQYYTQIKRGPKNETKSIRALYEYFSYGFLNESLILTFHDAKQKELFDINFELAWLTYIMQLPPGELSQTTRQYKYQLKQYADNLFWRSVGTEKGKTNERIAQQMSVLQHITTPLGGQSAGNRPGMLSKLGSLFR